MGNAEDRGKATAIAIAAGLLVLAWSVAALAEMPIVVNRPLTPQEIHDLGLPEGTQVSAGLTAIGVGAAAYLEAHVEKATTVNSVTWALTKPAGSNAALRPSPIGPEVRIYSVGEREIHKIAGPRQLLVPDVKGQYTVTATIVTDSTTVTPALTITAATYVGVGTVGGATAQFPQCALCHADKAASWADTRHASKLQREIDGLGSAGYNAACIKCHTVGFDAAPTAVNGGFDDVMATTGWKFPTVTATDGTVKSDLKAGNFAAMPPQLQAVANIQCENCHGPGSEHAGNPAKIAVSLDAGDCAQCHDEQPYHNKAAEWQRSRHAITTRAPTGENRETCVICHSGIGFINRIDGGYDLVTPNYATLVTDVTYEAITCQVCHDPHDATNPNQLRRTDDVTLITGDVITEGGTGKLCMNCHKARRGGEAYAGTFHTRHNPHESPQADMLNGTGGATYGAQIRSSSHLYAVDDACATCHMQSVARTDPAWLHAGGHTYKPVFDNGTPDDESDDVDLTAVCASCHGPMASFNISREDFDGDGTLEGVQTEVEGLMEEIAIALPPLGENSIRVDSTFTEAQLKATWNHNFVESDGSRGIHNTRYAVGLLRASIKDLTGRDVITAVTAEVGEGTPAAFALAQNYPNPFNPTTDIRYSVARTADVRLDIYNSLGQRVRTLVSAYHSAGDYTVKWNGADDEGRKVTAGVYLYSLQAGDFASQRKMVLLP